MQRPLFLPSCHQKRVLQFGAWVTAHVLPPVPSRQYVFTIPKMLRVYFRKDRRLLGTLSQYVYACLKVFLQATLKKPQAVPGVIVAIQTFGDLASSSACHRLGWPVCAQRLVVCRARHRSQET